MKKNIIIILILIISFTIFCQNNLNNNYGYIHISRSTLLILKNVFMDKPMKINNISNNKIITVLRNDIINHDPPLALFIDNNKCLIGYFIRGKNNLSSEIFIPITNYNNQEFAMAYSWLLDFLDVQDKFFLFVNSKNDTSIKLEERLNNGKKAIESGLLNIRQALEIINETNYIVINRKKDIDNIKDEDILKWCTSFNEEKGSIEKIREIELIKYYSIENINNYLNKIKDINTNLTKYNANIIIDNKDILNRNNKIFKNMQLLNDFDDKRATIIFPEFNELIENQEIIKQMEKNK